MDSSSKCNKRLFEEYLMRRPVAEWFSGAIVKPFHDFVELTVSDL